MSAYAGRRGSLTWGNSRDAILGRERVHAFKGRGVAEVAASPHQSRHFATLWRRPADP